MPPSHDLGAERRRRGRSIAWGVSPRVSIEKRNQAAERRQMLLCPYFCRPSGAHKWIRGPDTWGSRPRLITCRPYGARLVVHPTVRLRPQGYAGTRPGRPISHLPGRSKRPGAMPRTGSPLSQKGANLRFSDSPDGPRSGMDLAIEFGDLSRSIEPRTVRH